MALAWALAGGGGARAATEAVSRCVSCESLRCGLAGHEKRETVMKRAHTRHDTHTLLSLVSLCARSRQLRFFGHRSLVQRPVQRLEDHTYCTLTSITE